MKKQKNPRKKTAGKGKKGGEASRSFSIQEYLEAYYDGKPLLDLPKVKKKK